MAGNKMGALTKEKILLAAEQEFLENGYEMARIDEIARRAGVTRAMLFYHFNSKQNIFYEIVRRFIDQVKIQFNKVMLCADLEAPLDFRARLAAMLDFYGERRAVLRLVLSEYISGRHTDASILSLFNEVFALIIALTGKDSGIDRGTFLTRILFFNAFPMLLYPCVSERFEEDYDFEPDQCRGTFIETFAEVFANNLSASLLAGRVEQPGVD